MENKKDLVLKAKLAYMVVSIIEDEEDSDVWCIGFNYEENEKIIITNAGITYACNGSSLGVFFLKNKIKIVRIGSFDFDRAMFLFDKLTTEYLDKINKSIEEKK